jgi:hypothetical protein
MKLNYYKCIVFLILIINCGASPQKERQLEKTNAEVKNLAILPFRVNLEAPAIPKNSNIDSLRKLKETASFKLQNLLYQSLSDKKDKFTNIQNITITNDLLKPYNIDYSNFKNYNIGLLCKVLKVDGIIMGNSFFKKLSTYENNNNYDYINFSMTIGNEINTYIKVFDSSGVEIWNYHRSSNGSIENLDNKSTRKAFNKISRFFPH